MTSRHTRFASIETWVFDLDNTLYHPSARLFEQIHLRMRGFIMRELGLGAAEADRLRARYWQSHGITMGGLVEHHGIDPHAFLAEVHDLDLAGLAADPGLDEALRALPGRRIVHTNGARAHAARVLDRLGLADAFERVWAIEDKALVPKPRAEAFALVVRESGLDPARTAMIEDDPGNLDVPKRMGMATVWLSHRRGGATPPHVDRRITRLAPFLREVVRERVGADLA